MNEYQQKVSAYDGSNFTWTRDYFLALINRLGDAQKLALALLVTGGSLSDEELRNALRVDGNQALAGCA